MTDHLNDGKRKANWPYKAPETGPDSRYQEQYNETLYGHYIYGRYIMVVPFYHYFSSIYSTLFCLFLYHCCMYAPCPIWGTVFSKLILIAHPHFHVVLCINYKEH